MLFEILKPTKYVIEESKSKIVKKVPRMVGLGDIP